MNKKGFTLVELLGIVILLSIMVLIAVPAINKVVRDGKDNANKSNYDVVINAAYDYVLKKNLTISTDTTTIKIIDLAKEGFLKTNDNEDTPELTMTDASGRKLDNDEIHIIKIENYDSNTTNSIGEDLPSGRKVGAIKYFGNNKFIYVIVN